ncbi:response regulator receiver domain-containing protein [Cecembia calidifontis]|uniref:Response regulator receiver domain-containing protein n=2 Tax=Cecembia calidifontis TaxID=1187080 RepID=A0A4Q7PCX1_9BACT|nr:response regulator receiver domain-containing protein [Cecembia calidifontis]
MFFIFFNFYIYPVNHSNHLIMKNILVIEDDKLISGLVSFRLKKEGFNITLAEDGMEGIKKFDALEPDLVITDVLVPYRNGIEIVEYAKKKRPNCPVIVLSCMGEEEETVIKAFQVGASDFMPKPFHPNELAFRVKRLIEN